jgi:hypothetical protein
MENLEIYQKVRAVPDDAKKTIYGGRLKGMTDINPMWRIKVLTEQFGACGIGWYYNTTRQWTESIGEETAAFVNIELFINWNGEWSKPILGTGGSMLAAKEKNGIYVSDECFKMATTDALSVACKQLGIGADVYWDKDSTKYSNNAETSLQTNANLNNDRLKDVYAALERTGYSVQALCNTYKLGHIGAISDLQIEDFIKKMKNVPDKKG